jgi:hypothetical protein
MNVGVSWSAPNSKLHIDPSRSRIRQRFFRARRITALIATRAVGLCMSQIRAAGLSPSLCLPHCLWNVR